MKIWFDIYESPIGSLYILMDEEGLVSIIVSEESWENSKSTYKQIERNENQCKEVKLQLEEYFKGKRKEFDVKLNINGTDFRKKVWEALKDIPYGETRSYSDIAKAVGNPKAVRAIGQANRSNPVPIIIPCHRVIGKDGKLTGYAGNKIDLKKILLDIEKTN